MDCFDDSSSHAWMILGRTGSLGSRPCYSELFGSVIRRLAKCPLDGVLR